MARAMRGTSGGNPFESIMKMISDMVAKLQQEGEEAARKKAFCDEELAKTGAKKVDLEDDLERLSTKIDKLVSKHQRLGSDAKQLQAEEVMLTQSLSEMQRLYREDQDEYERVKANVAQSLKGVQMAIKALSDYYSNSDDKSRSGSADVIIGILEDSEAKLNSWLMDVKANEQRSEQDYQHFVSETKIDLATKESEEKYKTKGTKKLSKATAEFSSDKDSEREELDALTQYYSKLQKECIAKPESYEERAKRRNAEIDGLKQALEVLNDDAVLLQEKTVRRPLRGVASRRQRAIAA
jgi:chromosome segregation ATPase